MLERVTACINRRGLAISNVRKASLSSRRMLHSAFWVHGGEALLDQILEGQCEPENVQHKILEKIKLLSSVFSGRGDYNIKTSSPGFEWFSPQSSDHHHTLSAFGLDFLYPPKAAALFKQLSIASLSKATDGRGFGKLARQYSSLIGDSAKARREARAREREDDEYEYAPSGMSEGLVDKRKKGTYDSWIPNERYRHLEHLNPKDFDMSEESFDRAWKWFNRETGAPRTPVMRFEDVRARRKLLLNYISFSNSRKDKERVIALIEGLDPLERRMHDYRHLVDAYLYQNQVEAALRALSQLSKSSLENIYVGFEALIAYTIRHDMWDRALAAWKLLQTERDGEPRYKGVKPEHIVEKVPYFTRKLVSWISNLLESDIIVRDFVTWLFHGVQKNFASERSIVSEQDIEVILQSLTARNWYLPDFADFEYEILGLSYGENHEAVVSRYEEYRKHPNAHPASILLDRILTATIHLHDFRVMQMVFDDWFKFHRQPSSKAYKAIMDTFAWRGETLICEDLFEQYSQRFKATASDFNNILRAYVQRGEMASAVAKLEGMSAYNLGPDIVCYNTLLEGFARAEDMEGAMEYLAKLLESGLEPSARTYSAMMYVCAARGDFENVEILFRAAGKRDIPTTPTMWNMLVWAHVNGGARSLAWKLIHFIYQQKLGFPMTHMYNMLMSAHANKKETTNVNRIYKEMRKREVPFDLHTYTIMMRGLTQTQHKGNLIKARRMLDLLVTEDIPTDTAPYVTLMQGYLRRRRYAEVFSIYKLMLERKVSPDFATQAMLLLASIFEAQELSKFTNHVDLRNAEEISRLAIERFSGYDPSNLSSIKSAVPDNIFTPLISAYIYTDDYESVLKTYQRFLEVAGQNGANSNKPSMNMLLKLMHASQRGSNWSGLRDLWKTTFQEAQRQSRPLTPISNGKNVLPIMKRKMCPAFDIMVRAAIDHLESVEKLENGLTTDEIAAMMREMTEVGFDLDGGNWNILIVLIAKSGDLYQALKIGETQLVREESYEYRIRAQRRYGFVGWAKHARHPHVHTMNVLAGMVQVILLQARTFGEEADKARALAKRLSKECPMMWKLCSLRRGNSEQAEREDMHEKLVDFMEIVRRDKPRLHRLNIKHEYNVTRKSRNKNNHPLSTFVTAVEPAPDSIGYERMDF